MIECIWIYHQWLKQVQEEIYTGPSWLRRQPSIKRISSLKNQVELIIDWLKELKNMYKIKVQRIRMDNTGEIKMLVKSCDQNETGIKFEYTAPGTHQKMELLEEHL